MSQSILKADTLRGSQGGGCCAERAAGTVRAGRPRHARIRADGGSRNGDEQQCGGEARVGVVLLGPAASGEAGVWCAGEAWVQCVDRHRADDGFDSGRDGAGCGERVRGADRGEPAVQGVDELPAGGAVRDAAGGADGASDAGGRVPCGRLVGNADRDADVVRFLRAGAFGGESVR